MAQAIRGQRDRRVGGGSSDDDDGGPTGAFFTDAKAKQVALLPERREFFKLRPCARTSFPAPFRMETLRFQDDFPEGETTAEAEEVKHLTILGSWNSSLNNELVAFEATPDHNDTAALQGMVLRCRVFSHQLSELCTARYDVLAELDGGVAAQLQERLLSPSDTFASKPRRTLHSETVTLRDRALNKGISSNQVKATQQGGRKRGGRRKKCGGDAAEPPKA